LKKRLLAAVLVLATAGLLAATASTASATPTKTTRCTSCHSGPNVAVTATLASTSGTAATYNLSAPSATAIAIFDGTTKVGSSIIGKSGQIVIPFGKTYTIYAIQGPTNSDGIGSTPVSPVAPVITDTTAPTTTSNAVGTYVSSAAITLTAVDNAGGSGVAHTYYVLDGAPQVEGLTVSTSAVGSHTLSFWSLDVAGNVEVAHDATFEVTTPPVSVPDTTAPTTASNSKAAYVGSASITLTAIDNAGGSGVAHTYYMLDGAAQAEGLTVSTSVVGSHTLSFWSVDVAGNIEAANAASFDVTAPPVTTTRASTIDSMKSARSHGHRVMRLKGTITPGRVGDHAYLCVQKPGSHRWIRVAMVTAKALNGNGGATWSYTYTMNVRGTYHFQVRLAGTPTTMNRQIERD
jgi:hypothetical protein